MGQGLGSPPFYSKELSKLKRKLDEYDNQEKRIIKLLRYDRVNEDMALDELSQLKRDRQEDQQRLEKLARLKEQYVDINKLESQMGKFCGRVKKNLDSCTLENKRLVLDALDVRVVATDDTLEIKLDVLLDFVSAKSSRYGKMTCSYNYPIGKMPRASKKYKRREVSLV